MSDVAEALRLAVSTGKVVIGSKRVLREAMFSKLKLIVLSSDCPEDNQNDVRHHAKLSGIPIHVFQGPSTDLGIVCGRLFRVATLGIKDPGRSKILKIIEKCQAKESE